MLVNAIYFKASWAEPFTPGATTNGPFFVMPDRSVTVPLMRKSNYFGYAKVDGAQLVELPYGDEQLSMVVVIPNERGGLPTIEKQLPAQLAAWIGHLSTPMVDLTFPRFKIASSFSLAESLKRIGMPLPFTFPGADFSGIDDTKLLFISQVVHQAVVAVDEKGTEARRCDCHHDEGGRHAAATRGGTRRSSLRVSHPRSRHGRNLVHAAASSIRPTELSGAQAWSTWLRCLRPLSRERRGRLRTGP